MRPFEVTNEWVVSRVMTPERSRCEACGVAPGEGPLAGSRVMGRDGVELEDRLYAVRVKPWRGYGLEGVEVMCRSCFREASRAPRMEEFRRLMKESKAAELLEAKNLSDESSDRRARWRKRAAEAKDRAMRWA